MPRSEITAFVDDLGLSVTIPENLDEGFMGVATEEDPPRAVYSVERCINILAEEMTQDEATEHFWHNVAGYGGAGYPLFITTPEDESPY